MRLSQSPPVASLLDTCLRVVVRYLHCLDDVGDVDDRLLAKILRHCNEHQLRRIEKGTKGRDLSGVVDPQWKNQFLLRFGQEAVVERTAWMKRERLLYTWRQLYDAKEADQKAREEEAARKLTERLKQMEEEFPKMHVKVVAPRDSDLGKRKRWGSAGGGSSSSFIKKAKVQITRSLEGRSTTGVMSRRTVTPALPRPPTRPLPLTAGELLPFVQMSPGCQPVQRPLATAPSGVAGSPALSKAVGTSQQQQPKTRPGSVGFVAGSATCKRGHTSRNVRQSGVQSAQKRLAEPGSQGKRPVPARTEILPDRCSKRRAFPKLRK